MSNELNSAIESIVIRAREGDENAMALIVSIREQASKGIGKAKKSFALLKNYIEAHPVQLLEIDIGAEAEHSLSILKEVGPIVGLPILGELIKSGNDALFAASVILANGTKLASDKIKEIAISITSSNEAELFSYAVCNSTRNIAEEAFGLDKEAKKIFYAGLCIGLAQNIQRVRQPKSIISRFAPMAGWELSS
jgi:hypothetical protein